MREIKFRAWVDGKMINDFYIPTYGGEPSTYGSDSNDMVGDYMTLNRRIPTPTMQFTGLHDKNGREIYEGDVCRFDVREGGVGEPAYHGLIGKVGFSFGCYTIGDFSSHYCNLEVIGNVYENPELLEGDKP